jgi:hypothetical protein
MVFGFTLVLEPVHGIQNPGETAKAVLRGKRWPPPVQNGCMRNQDCPWFKRSTRNTSKNKDSILECPTAVCSILSRWEKLIRNSADDQWTELPPRFQQILLTVKRKCALIEASTA